MMILGGMRGGKQVVVEPHRHAGVFIARGKEDALVTKNMVVGDAVYGEKRISVDVMSILILALLSERLDIISHLTLD